MIRNILNPIGISDSLSSDIHYAFHIADRFMAKLTLLQAHLPHHHTAYPVSDYVGGASTMMVEPMNMEAVKQSIEKQLRKEVPEIQKVDYELLALPGLTTDIIVEQSEELDPDLIVINDGRESDMQIIFESIPQKVSRKSYCPTLIVPEDHTYQPLKKTSLAIDDKNIDENIPFDDLMTWIKEYNTSLDVIHVHDGSKKEVTEAQDTIYPILKDKMSAYGIKNYTFRTVLEEETKKGISDFVHRHDIDLLALIHRDHGFFKRLFNPGVRKQLIGDSKVPILILK
jgi:nucleotide-binding universal stress UspA family protein